MSEEIEELNSIEYNKMKENAGNFCKFLIQNEQIFKFEKKCGYFDTWKERFESPDPEGFMDNLSLYIWKEMKREFNLK